MFRPGGIVLMYHRIAAPDTDPWELAVSPDHFEQHLKILKKTRQVIPLPQLVQEINNGSLPGKRIAITFDDGYLDNYLAAKPLLEQYELPATFFVASLNIGKRAEFWWDELENILLETPVLPPKLDITIAGEPFQFNLEEERNLTDQLRERHKSFAYEANSLRSLLYLNLWEKLTPMAYEDQQEVLGWIREWAGNSLQVRETYSCMSTNQLTALAKSDLFTIGGHTSTHPALAYHTKEKQRDEITSNKQFLECIAGKAIDLFAYPSGNYNVDTVEVLKELGFKGSFTTYSGSNYNREDAYRLKRLQVTNRDGSSFSRLISQ